MYKQTELPPSSILRKIKEARLESQETGEQRACYIPTGGQGQLDLVANQTPQVLGLSLHPSSLSLGGS